MRYLAEKASVIITASRVKSNKITICTVTRQLKLKLQSHRQSGYKWNILANLYAIIALPNILQFLVKRILNINFRRETIVLRLHDNNEYANHKLPFKTT